MKRKVQTFQLRGSSTLDHIFLQSNSIQETTIIATRCLEWWQTQWCLGFSLSYKSNWRKHKRAKNKQTKKQTKIVSEAGNNFWQVILVLIYAVNLNLWTASGYVQREKSSKFHLAKNGCFLHAYTYLPSIFCLLCQNNSTDWLCSSSLRFVCLTSEP